MNMTHKRRKALARRKAIVKARSIKQRNMPRTGSIGQLFQPKSHVYRLYDI